MRITKLILGIINIVLGGSIVLLLGVGGSCIGAMSNVLDTRPQTSVESYVVTISFFALFLAVGIISVSTRNSYKIAGSISCAVLCLLVAIYGCFGSGTFVFAPGAIWPLACMIFYIADVFYRRLYRTPEVGIEEKPQMGRCRYCGMQFSGSENFCPNCGNKIE